MIYVRLLWRKAKQGIVSKSSPEQSRKMTYFSKILFITRDGKYFFYDYDKDEFMRPTPKAKLHGIKIVLCVWWDQRGMINFELLNRKQAFNGDLYSQQLFGVHENLRKCHSLVKRRSVVLLYENTRPHSARITQKNIGFRLVCSTLPSYSPELALNDFHLFFFLFYKIPWMTKIFLQKIRRKFLWKTFWARNQLNFIWEESTHYLMNLKKWI